MPTPDDIATLINQAAAEASYAALAHGDWDAEFLKALQRRGLRLTPDKTPNRAPMPAQRGYPHPSFVTRVLNS